MHVIEQIKQVAVAMFSSALSVAPDHDGYFRAMIPFKLGNETKPLLLQGTAHGKIEDGHVVAILNPEHSLLDRRLTGCSRAVLKDIVTNKCDAALDIWVDAYRENGVTVMTRYRSRNPQPAKFCVT